MIAKATTAESSNGLIPTRVVFIIYFAIERKIKTSGMTIEEKQLQQQQQQLVIANFQLTKTN